MRKWYQPKLASHPTPTNTITTAILFALGDVLAQQFVEKKGSQNHELARTARMAFYGTAIWRPAVTHWFKFLQTRIVFPHNRKVEMAVRVAVDQTLFAPTGLFVFLTSMSIMEGSSPREKLDRSDGTALKRKWMVWPFVQLVNFRFVPLESRVVVVNGVPFGVELLFELG